MATVQERKNVSGDTVHRVIIRRKGHYASETFGTREQADNWSFAMESRIAAGFDVSGGEVTLAMTVRTMLQKFITEETPKKRGARSETQMLNTLMERFTLFDKTLAEFSSTDIQTIIDARLRGNKDHKPVMPGTVIRELGMLSGAFNHAIKKWKVKLDVNPCKNVERPKTPAPRKTRVFDEVQNTMLAELGYVRGTKPVTAKQWVGWSMLFAVETAMRRGELLGVKWHGVQLDDDPLIHLAMTKNGDERDVPLSSRALALLALLDRPTSGGLPLVPVSLSHFSNTWNTAKRATGLAIRFHDTRREACSRMCLLVPNVLFLKRITGHKSTRMLEIYFHPTNSNLRGLLG